VTYTNRSLTVCPNSAGAFWAHDNFSDRRRFRRPHATSALPAARARGLARQDVEASDLGAGFRVNFVEFSRRRRREWDSNSRSIFESGPNLFARSDTVHSHVAYPNRLKNRRCDPRRPRLGVRFARSRHLDLPERRRAGLLAARQAG